MVILVNDVNTGQYCLISDNGRPAVVAEQSKALSQIKVERMP